MPKTRAPYAPEFRRQIVDLVRAGRDPDDLAREFEPTAQSIRNWVAVDGAKIGGREEKGSGPADADELVRLRREVRQLRQERASGQFPDHGHGACARGVDGGLRRLAQANAVGTRRS